MTSRRYWFVLVTLSLIMSIFLVACERPMPGSDDIPATVTTSETDSSAYPEADEADTGEYPGPAVPEADDKIEGYPAGEGEEVSSAELIQPDEEGVIEGEGYPVAEDEDAGEEEVANEDDVQGDDESSAEGEATGEDETTTEGEATSESGTVAEGDAATDEGDASGEASSEGGTTTEGETTSESDAASEGEATGEGGRSHIVASGDNLYRIAAQYGISWVTLAEANNITDPNSLAVGQELIIPDASIDETTESVESTKATDGAEAVEAAEESETTESAEDAESTESTEDAESTEGAESTEDAGTTEAEESTPDESAEITHVVQSGENLYRISLKYGVSMIEIARVNGLTDFNQLNVGQELIIPTVESTDGESEEVTHEVQEGETVFSIAFQRGIAWTNLVEANDISSPYTLELGQVLVIPLSE
jgi:LysM repeat protein